MAVIKEMTPDEMVEWRQWVEDLPLHMQESVDAHPPWLLYRHEPTGERVVISSYNEDGTVCMIVSGTFNVTLFDREVFGVPLSDLEECELPMEGEAIGEILTTEDEVNDFIRQRREEMFGKPH